MPNDLYFTAVVFLFFRRLISEVTERISTKLGHIFTYDCTFRNLVRTPPGIYPPPRAGAKKVLRTDFELQPNISLQRNMMSTIKVEDPGDSLAYIESFLRNLSVKEF